MNKENSIIHKELGLPNLSRAERRRLSRVKKLKGVYVPNLSREMRREWRKGGSLRDAIDRSIKTKFSRHEQQNKKKILP